MPQHSEFDYIIPTLFVLCDHPEGCPTEVVKEEIVKYVTLTDDDLKPYPSRNNNEPRYHQIVGNLISHANEALFQYINRIIPEEEVGKKKPKYIMLLNEKGKLYVQTLMNEIKEANEANNENISNEVSLDKYDQKIIDLVLKSNGIVKSFRDQKLAKEVIEISNYKCQYAVLTNTKHQMFLGSDGKPYAEAHHLIPMKASKDFFPRNLDRASNLVCLCPNCHTLLHRGSREEKRELLKVLYDHYITVLNEDEGIFISFEKLLEKYY